MTQRYRRNPKASERRMGDSVFLANPEYGTLYRLNETAAALWRLLENATSLDEAIEAFQGAFPDTPPEEIEEEVSAVFDDLHEEGLIDPES